MEQYNMILRLQELGFSIKGIARQLGLARNTIYWYLSDQGGYSPPGANEGFSPPNLRGPGFCIGWPQPDVPP